MHLYAERGAGGWKCLEKSSYFYRDNVYYGAFFKDFRVGGVAFFEKGPFCEMIY
jgi:hypothetical protein